MTSERETPIWDEFSGRLEAVERVEIRSRVSGAIQEIHFREGALVKKGDLLIRIDPALYAAEVARAEAQVAAAQARLVFTKSDYERGQQLSDRSTISQRDLDNRTNAYREAKPTSRRRRPRSRPRNSISTTPKSARRWRAASASSRSRSAT